MNSFLALFVNIHHTVIEPGSLHPTHPHLFGPLFSHLQDGTSFVSELLSRNNLRNMKLFLYVPLLKIYKKEVP